MFSFLYFLLASSNVMKIIVKKDIEFYNGGYYHPYYETLSTPTSFQEFNISEASATPPRLQYCNIMNKIHLYYEKKDLLDYLLDPKENNHDKLIRCVKLNDDFQYNIGGVTITNGGLFNDWMKDIQ